MRVESVQTQADLYVWKDEDGTIMALVFSIKNQVFSWGRGEPLRKAVFK